MNDMNDIQNIFSMYKVTDDAEAYNAFYAEATNIVKTSTTGTVQPKALKTVSVLVFNILAGLNQIKGVEVSAIEDTKGNYKKIPNLDELILLSNNIQKLDPKNSDLKIIPDCVKFLEKNRAEFMRGYKKDYSLVKLIYFGIVTSMYNVSGYHAIVVGNSIVKGKNISKEVAQFKTLPRMQKHLRSLITKDVEELIKIDYEKGVVFRESIENLGELLEVSEEGVIGDLTTLFHFNLMKGLYRILGPLRYLIYTFKLSKEKRSIFLEDVAKANQMFNGNDTQIEELNIHFTAKAKAKKVESVEDDFAVEKLMTEDKMEI